MYPSNLHANLFPGIDQPQASKELKNDKTRKKKGYFQLFSLKRSDL